MLSKKPPKEYFSRQKLPKVFEINASIYIFRREFFKKNNSIFNSKTSVYLMPRERSVDIDDLFDLKVVKNII